MGGRRRQASKKGWSRYGALLLQRVECKRACVASCQGTCQAADSMSREFLARQQGTGAQEKAHVNENLLEERVYKDHTTGCLHNWLNQASSQRDALVYLMLRDGVHNALLILPCAV